jgi:hypothetical protein
MRDTVEAVLPTARGISVRPILGFDAAGFPLVAAGSDDTSGVAALSLVALTSARPGDEVAVAWLEAGQPLIIGLIQAPAIETEADGDRGSLRGGLAVWQGEHRPEGRREHHPARRPDPESGRAQ